MTRYNVHLYREMRLYFPGLEADTPEAAAEFARQQTTDKADSIHDCDGNSSSALVDLIGDEDYRQSKVVDFLPDLLPILKHAVETEERNWDDAEREPDWMQAARAAIAAAGGAQ